MLANRLHLIIKGFCIGSADIIPGVSGSTIAFILGIYSKLINAINKEFNLKLRESIRGKKTLTAKLTNITNDLVCFQSGDEEINLNFFDLDQCRLKPDFKEIMRINNGKY